MGYYLLDHPNPNAPQFTFPRRGNRGRLTGTCILHTSEGYGALATAAFIARRTDYGSYHRLCDWDTIIRMAPWEYEVWQDSETNNWAVGISAAVKAAEWHLLEAGQRDRVYRNMAACAAEFVTYMRDEHGINVPIARISGAQARAGVPGFCAHGDSGLYRSDPGAQFDWDLFFDYTRQALGGGLAAMGATATEEDDMSKQAEDHLARLIEIAEENERVNVRGRIVAIDERTAALLETIKYVKGTDEPHLYEINEATGALRLINGPEWEVTGKDYRVLPQAVINALPKEN